MSTVDNIKMYLHVTVTRVEHTVQMMYWGSSWCILHLSLFWCTLIWMYQDLESKTDIGNKSTFFLYRFICCFIQGIRGGFDFENKILFAISIIINITQYINTLLYSTISYQYLTALSDHFPDELVTFWSDACSNCWM